MLESNTTMLKDYDELNLRNFGVQISNAPSPSFDYLL